MGKTLHNRLLRLLPEWLAGPHTPRARAVKAAALSVLSIGLATAPAHSQIVAVGSGSYTTQFPGTDAAGRNAVPAGSPLLSGVAATKPVPTNEWWSGKLRNNHTNNIFNYPLTLRTHETGLVVNYIIPPASTTEYRQPNSDVMAVTVGVQSLNATAATVSDYSDWTVTMNWHSGSNDFNATVGMGMPFVYLTKGASDVATVKVAVGTVTINGEMLLIKDSYNGADYAVYAPVGSTWTNNAGTYTSTLNGKTYWSIALLNPTAPDALAAANAYKQYAYVFPASTKVDWVFTESTSVVKTTFTVTPSVKEGANGVVLQGLLPHQWGYMAAGSAQPAGQIYPSVRGQLKMLAGNVFSTAYTFHGILPTLPYLDNYSTGFSPVKLNDKVQALQNNGLAEWTDSYNEGQEMNKLIQTARIADETGNTAARDQIVNTIKNRLQDWLSAESGENAFVFYYNSTWSTLFGYPAGHHQDDNINDHHFHWGYFIHAAAFLEQYQPGWAGQWGAMVNMLVRDAANPSRTDTQFPFLRNFDPYAGHSWADGFASSPMGNNQESTSESMQFNSSLIHWGAITGNKATRDLGIYLYATEQAAIEEYWFDVNDRTFQPNYAYSATGRVWGAGYDAGTFWTQDIRAVYGIQLYPMHGGSLYLGQNHAYVQKLWTEITQNTGILQNEVNANTWHDLLWEYLAFIDPVKAIQLYDGFPNRPIKFGVSDAQTYYWLHAMNALGRVDASVTANNPEAVVFNKAGVKTYVAHNYTNAPITVNFSDGYVLNVPARKLATSKDVAVAGTLTTNASEVAANGSVTLSVATTGSGVTGVEFFDGSTSLGTVATAPYTKTAANLNVAIHNFYAKVYAGSLFKVTNIASVQVGKQTSFTGAPQAVPGTIEAGKYDTYAGGLGQGIAYNDASASNQATFEPSPTVAFRPTEYVDAVSDAAEGTTVGWVDAGEWLEYTINVATAGTHTLALRYAAGNSTGGGPFSLSIDGNVISANQTVTTTGDWGAWGTKTITGLNLPAGEHVLRLSFTQGGLNVGRMTFTYTGTSTNTPPTVSLTSPANGAGFTAPASITINANAADANGTVSKVEFFQGATKLGEDLTSPYSYVWTGVAAGTYSLTAKATDNAGAVTTSTAVSVSVTAAPTAQAIPGTIEAESYTAQQGTDKETTTDTGGGQNVDWYETGDWLDYSVNVASAGQYTVGFRVASANGGATLQLRNSAGTVLGSVNVGNTGGWQSWQTQTTTVTLPAGVQTLRLFASASTGTNVNWLSFTAVTTNTPPTVSLTSPANGASFTAPASITINANAADANGTVSSVAFYNGTTLLGTDTSSPYSYTWTGVAAGTYSITARATDNAGAVTTSSAVSVTVTAAPVGQTIPGTIQAESYSAMLGIQTETTTDTGGGLNVGYIEAGDWMDYAVNVTTAGQYTVGFRLASEPGGGSLQLRNSAGTSLGSVTVGATGGWQSWQTLNATVTLPAGAQTLRVYATAGGVNINWLSFTAVTTNTPPTVSLTSPSNGATFTAPASITINATAADANGTVSSVAFYNGTTLLGTDTSSPYSYTWTGVAAGTYSITAKATDNAGAVTTSSAVSVSVSNASTGGYCAVTSDFSYGAVSSGGNLTITFHPLGATAGGNLALLYLRQGTSGAYPGYTMTKNAAGDFTYTLPMATGTVVNLYFTYQVGAGGPERNNSATPFSYTVGTSCNLQARTGTALATNASSAATAELHVAPTPSLGDATVHFRLPQAGAYTLTLYDMNGRLLRTLATGQGSGAQTVTLNTRQYSAGVYVVRLTAGQQTLTQRLVVSH
ncbi:carbohydrate-binding protein [Hymenobacter guriensis]|uniref:glucan endo-1,3-beta-D-glucosidase n=1 Tax=Hymenobacter guriensis TaxID=2793065 RepID=A0ABS0L922_9BACT|nr:carbohydrate-binding protein [Hymenobacter guriensis]MBG8555974.1 carbohydrate-binding protein [Hymenobacter guriensis]